MKGWSDSRQRMLGRAPRTVVRRGAPCLGALLLALPADAFEGGLQIVPDPRTLALLIVFFALLIAPLQTFLFRPLLRVLDERAKRIEGARRRAQELGRQAQELADRHARTVGETRRDAEGQRRARLDETKRKNGEAITETRSAAEAEIERARQEILAALADARSALRTDANDLGRLLAERLLGRSLS